MALPKRGKINGIFPTSRSSTSKQNGVTKLKSVAKNPLKMPSDWLSGGMKNGAKYQAWDTFGQGKPDFGKGKGPGDPYHSVTRTVGKPHASRPQIPRNKTQYNPKGDARLDAIQRRLRGL